MLLPELRKVGVQLGIDGAVKMPKAALVTAISDLQAANRAASAKPARKSAQQRKKARLKKLVTLILGMKVLAIAAKIAVMIVVTATTAMIVMTATTAMIVMTVVIVVATVIVIVIATVIATALHAKSVNQLFPKMMF
jgi:hypothetical protein